MSAPFSAKCDSTWSPAFLRCILGWRTPFIFSEAVSIYQGLVAKPTSHWTLIHNRISPRVLFHLQHRENISVKYHMNAPVDTRSRVCDKVYWTTTVSPVHLAVTWPSPRHLRHLGTTSLDRMWQLIQPIFKAPLSCKATVSPVVKVAVAILLPIDLALETMSFLSSHFYQMQCYFRWSLLPW